MQTEQTTTTAPAPNSQRQPFTKHKQTVHNWASPQFIEQTQIRLNMLEAENLEMLRLFTELKNLLTRKTVSVQEFADFIGYHYDTVADKCRTGEIKAVRPLGTKKYIIPISELDRFITLTK